MAEGRVAFLINSMEGGGAERVAQLLMEEASRRGGSEIAFLLLLRDRVTLPVPSSVRIVARESHPTSGLGKALALLPQALWLKRLLREEGVDVVVSFLERSNLVNVLSRILGATHRVVITEHTHPGQSYAGRSLGVLGMRWLIRRLYSRGDTILAVSHGVKDSLQCRYGVPEARITVVHDPCNLRRIVSLAAEPVELPWEKNGIPTICNVGRLAPPKGHKYLLSAFAILREMTEARLLLIGEGALEEDLQDEAARLGISESVIFLGWQDNPYKYMVHATLFASSSLWEGFGIAIVEALACGVPVVAFDCDSGPREILEGGRCGVLVPVGDVEQLAKEMVALLRDGARRKKLAELGKRRAADFDLQVGFSIYEQAWQCKPDGALPRDMGSPGG